MPKEKTNAVSIKTRGTTSTKRDTTPTEKVSATKSSTPTLTNQPTPSVSVQTSVSAPLPPRVKYPRNNNPSNHCGKNSRGKTSKSRFGKNGRCGKGGKRHKSKKQNGGVSLPLPCDESASRCYMSASSKRRERWTHAESMVETTSNPVESMPASESMPVPVTNESVDECVCVQESGTSFECVLTTRGSTVNDPNTIVAVEVVKDVSSSILEQASRCIEGEEYHEASVLCEFVLNTDPENKRALVMRNIAGTFSKNLA